MRLMMQHQQVLSEVLQLEGWGDLTEHAITPSLVRPSLAQHPHTPSWAKCVCRIVNQHMDGISFLVLPSAWMVLKNVVCANAAFYFLLSQTDENEGPKMPEDIHQDRFNEGFPDQIVSTGVFPESDLQQYLQRSNIGDFEAHWCVTLQGLIRTALTVVLHDRYDSVTARDLLRALNVMTFDSCWDWHYPCIQEMVWQKFNLEKKFWIEADSRVLRSPEEIGGGEIRPARPGSCPRYKEGCVCAQCVPELAGLADIDAAKAESINTLILSLDPEAVTEQQSRVHNSLRLLLRHHSKYRIGPSMAYRDDETDSCNSEDSDDES